MTDLRKTCVSFPERNDFGKPQLKKRPHVSICCAIQLDLDVTLAAVSSRSDVRADVKAILGLAIDRGAPGDVLGKVDGGGAGNDDERLNHRVGRDDGDGSGGLGGGVDDSIDGRVNGSLNVSVVLSTLDTIGLGKLVDVGSGLGGAPAAVGSIDTSSI